MSTPIDIQIIRQDGRPAFVVIPYRDFVKIRPPFIPDDGESVPHEVIGMSVRHGYTLFRAWREYLGLTREEVASWMNVTVEILQQIESGDKKLTKSMREKLAMALKLHPNQLCS